MLNIHFSTPRRAETHDLKWVDVLARQAADYLERKQTERDVAAQLKSAESRDLTPPITTPRTPHAINA